MKKFLIAVMLVCVSLPGFSKEESKKSEAGVFGSHYNGEGFALRFSFGPTTNRGMILIPGVELIMGMTDPDGLFPVDWGILGAAIIRLAPDTSGVGGGAFATAHFGLKALDNPVLKNIDILLGPGIGFIGWYNGFSFLGTAGLQYFITEKISIYLEYNFFSDSSGNLGINLLL